MTKKTEMISVPRELMEHALSAIEQVGYQDKFIDYTFTGEVKLELNRVLAAPAEDVRAVVEEPVLWFKRLPGLQAKANGECYDVMFVEVPGYTPLYDFRELNK